MAARNARSLILASPFTWLALVICSGLVWSFAIWFEPPFPVFLGTVIMAVFLFLMWPFFYKNTEEYVMASYGLDDQEEETEDFRVSRLIEDFKGLGFTEGIGQVKMIRQKYRNLAEVLKRRLDSGELTHRRYLAMAESVYLASLENLHDVAISLRSISTIDPEALSLRLLDLKKEDGFTVPEAISALEERRRLYEEQRLGIARLLGQTESAMTTLDMASAALARTRISKGLTDSSIEEAMKDLEELASRTGKYSADAGGSLFEKSPAKPFK